VDQARTWGVPCATVVTDAGYGDNPTFLHGLDARQVAYVVGVSSTFKPRHDLLSTSASLRRLAFLRGKICNAQKNKDGILEKALKIQSA
jgi:hypothetical protein